MPVSSLKYWRKKGKDRPVAQLVEYRSPKPRVGGSRPPWPANHELIGLCRLVFLLEIGIQSTGTACII